MTREEDRVHACRPRGRAADVLELVHDGTIDMEAVFAQSFREFHLNAVELPRFLLDVVEGGDLLL